MQDLYDEPALRRLQRQLNHEVEHGIKDANRDIIHAQIPALDKERFVSLAVAVARLRAAYLSEALRLTDPEFSQDPPTALIQSLKARREAYEEARAAFEALQRAIERGYLELDGLLV